MMHSTFYWGKELTLLVDSWKAESWTSYALTLLLCFLVSAFYQRLEALIKFTSVASGPSPSSQSESTPLLISRKLRPSRRARLASALLFGVNSAMGFLIMLAIMSYNGGVFLSVILGLTVGYYLFRSGEIGDGENDLIAATM